MQQRIEKNQNQKILENHFKKGPTPSVAEEPYLPRRTPPASRRCRSLSSSAPRREGEGGERGAGSEDGSAAASTGGGSLIKQGQTHGH